MKYSPVISSATQLDWLDDLNVDEVILYSETLSREGGLSQEEIFSLADKIIEKKWKVLIQVDRLVEENHFDAILKTCFNFSESWVMRVQDLGLAQAFYEANREFHLVLEAGHANNISIQTWCELLKGPLKRVVLNNEIPKRNLNPILSKLKVESETLGFGALIMYYTPRSLLSFSGHEQKQSLIQSDEMGLGHYRLLENKVGTVMYFNKDLSLLRYVDELDASGLTNLRLDLREVEEDHLLLLKESLLNQSDEPIKEAWPRPLLHGFYGENKSDSIFNRLTTKKVDWEREPFAEVLDQTKTRLLVRSWIENLNLPLKINAKDGKGRWHEWMVENVESLKDRSKSSSISETVFFLERPRKFASGTLLYRGEKSGV